MDASLDVDTGIALVFRAGSGPGDAQQPPRWAASPTRSTGTSWPTLTIANADATPMNLLTVADGLGITVGSVGVSGGVDVNSGQLSALVSAALTKGLLSPEHQAPGLVPGRAHPARRDLDFDLTLGWSSAHGLFIEGNASPHFDIGLNTDIGPFHLGVLHLALTLGQPDLPLEISFDGSAPRPAARSPCSGSASPPT